MTEITDDIEAVVEDTGLPKRLKDEVYSTVEERDGVTVEHADRIAKAVENRYLDTRVDPLDPVGTVSAQSIGEPGTQMSVPHDERVLVRRDGETSVAEIGPLVDEVIEARETRSFDGHEVALGPGGLEVLSLRSDEQVQWKPVEEVSRHDTPDELLRFELGSGRTIRATKAHSFVTKTDDEITPVAGDSLTAGDELPVIGSFDGTSDTADFSSVDVDERLLTDGGSLVSDRTTATTDSVVGAASWERIESVETVASDHEYVYDFSVEGLETFTTAEGVVTHNTMNTFHYAGVAEIDVTQGLPRLIELVDARKTPDTPMMTVFLEEEFADDRERAHEVVWGIEATKILALGDISTNVADMRVQISLNEDTLQERWPRVDSTDEVAGEIAGIIEDSLGVQTVQQGTSIEFGPEEPSYRDLLQLVEELRDITFKGIEEVTRVVIRKEDLDDGEEFVLYTEGSAFGDVLSIEGVDASRTTCNNIHEIYRNLGVEAAREAIIEETMDTLEEQGLDDVNIRHLMLVADIMTNQGTIESIGRHGISGSKDSVLARAAFEVTVNHLLDAAIHGEVDDLDGVTENVIVGKPIKLGTGDVDLKMGSFDRRSEQAD
ncbi:DNA-directed RNA polymerase subunit A'' [Halobacteriales archaeon QS_9_68_17]|nr:MAG: DNA-directed RNA polymerase subunit A'' [Halobacteriales archaeon QS_9_68_17]